MNKTIKMLSYKGEVCGEVRPAYFLKAFNRQVLSMRIFSMGACNFACPYCKRDGQYRNNDGSILTSQNVADSILLQKVESAVKNGEVVRVSGGDPVAYPKTSIEILRRTKQLGGIGSIAHNGSSPKMVSAMVSENLLDFTAIDFKAATKEEYSLRTGLPVEIADKMMQNSLQVQSMLANAGILVDVRTCIFASTTIDDLLTMANHIVNSGNLNNKFWTLRLYSPVSGCSWQPPQIETVFQNIQIVKQEFPKLKIGLRAKWEAEGFMIF